MEKRHLTVDFYGVQVDAPNGKRVTFDALAKKIETLAPGEPRNCQFSSSPVRLEEFFDDDDFCEGNLVRIRMASVPDKAGLQEPGVFPVPLKDNEGICEQTAFLYHKETETLLLQRGKYGPSATHVETYFPEKSGIKCVMRLFPVLQPKAMHMLRKNSFKPRSLHLKVAPLRNLSLFADSDDDTATLLGKHAQRFTAPFIEMEIKVSHERSAVLSWDAIRRTAGALLSIRSAEPAAVPKIQLQGTDEEDGDRRTMLLDFITDRLTETVSCPLAHRRLCYNARRDALREAWQRQQHVVHQYRAPALV